MPLSRRAALRFALPLALSPTSTLLAVEEPAETPFLPLDTAEEWSMGTKSTKDGPDNTRAVTGTAPAKGTVFFWSRALSDAERDELAHARRLRFRYRVDEAALESLVVKIVASPLAGGLEAVYPLPVPPRGEWREASLPVQAYEMVWGTENPPRTTGGSLQFRIGKTEGATPRVSVADIRVTLLPTGARVNTAVPDEAASGTGKAVRITPLVTKEAMMRLPEHPRLLFTRTDLPAIKRRATQTEWGRAFVADLKTRLDATLARPIDLPNRGGQWPHYYACPKHGTRLKQESPTRHVCPTGGEVYSGYPYDDVVLLYFHNNYATDIRDLGVLYQLTGDAKYAARARAILLAYAEKYLTYPLHTIKNEAAVGGGRVGPQTLDEAVWLIPVAQGCDCIWDTLSEADRETLKTRLFYPAAIDVIQKHKMGIHNIQCWKNSAVGLTGLLYGDAALVSDAIDNPDRGMQAQLAQGISNDGPWYEGAWGYHFYTMSALAPLAEAAQNAGIDVYQGPSGDRYRKFYAAPVEMAMPDGRLPGFNDSTSATANGNAHYELALARWNDPLLAAPLRASNRKTLYALLTGPEALPAAPAEADPSRVFADAGVALLRAGSGANAACLTLKYGTHGGGHGHPDKLNFVLYGGERMIADDPGITTYGVPIHGGWYRTTIAHNTLVVDETSQKPATGKLLAFESGKDWTAVFADAGPIYDGVTFRRAAFLLGTNVAVFLDTVEVTDGTPRTLDLAVHPNGTWQSQGGNGIGGTLPDKLSATLPGYSYLRDVTAHAAPVGSEGVGDHHLLTTSSSRLVFSQLTDGASGTVYFTGTGVGKNTEDRVPVVIARRKAVTGRSVYIWAISFASKEGDTAPNVTLLPQPGKGNVLSVAVTIDKQPPRTITADATGKARLSVT